MNDTEPDQQPSSESTERYRRRAERLVGQTLEEPEIDPRELLHELRVHQVELEMQIDELRQSEQRQQQLLKRAEDLFDHAPVALLTADPTGMILRTNRDARRLLGMAVRGTHRPLMVAVERDDHHAVRQLLDAALAGQPAAARVTLRARQGRPWRRRTERIRRRLAPHRRRPSPRRHPPREPGRRCPLRSW